MNNSSQGIGIGAKLELFRIALSKLVQGEGSIVCINGDAGFGKTYLLNAFLEEARGKERKLKSVFVESQAPIGKFNLGNIQPMLPFSRAMEKIVSDKEVSAEKRLAKSMFLTTLASMPFVGDVFYFVKETARDWREYKKEKTSEKTSKVSSAVLDFYDAFLAYADKQPIVILIDDMHWSDAQSVELLGLFAESMRKVPVLLAFTYRESLLDSKGYPLLRFITKYAGKAQSVIKIDLEAFSKENISQMCRDSFVNYRVNPNFEDWLADKTMGVPGVIAEYMKYFSMNPPFNSDGSLNDEVLNRTGLFSADANNVFAQLLDKLSEEERNILSVCSAEGKEFTAAIVSKLLNSDVLTTIKKLRSLQNRTGIIKSAGAQFRYGMKTTVYRFSRAFYHSFFEKSLEYEEHVALHGQIASILQKEYDDSEIPEIRDQLAPYIAAHSAESGDDETAKKMMLHSAQAANKYGSGEIVKEAYENFVRFGQLTDKIKDESNEELDSEELAFQEILRSSGVSDEAIRTEVAENGENSQKALNVVDFGNLRKAIVQDFNKMNFDSALQLANTYINSPDYDMSREERVQLLCFAARASIELERLSEAEEYCNIATSHYDIGLEEVTACVYLNTMALLRAKQERQSDASIYLEQAAKLMPNLPNELRLLTIANIGLIMSESSPEQAKRYINAAIQLSDTLKFEDLSKLIRN